MAVSFKGAHFPQGIILTGVRWYVASPLSTRHVEELMRERGVKVDHSTINRWVIKYSPQLEEEFHWKAMRLRASVRPNSSTLWPPNPLVEGVNSPQIVYTPIFATEPRR
jgi:transposase-like protein